MRRVTTDMVSPSSLNTLRSTHSDHLYPGVHCPVCRSLNEKIFPILSVTEMTGSFYNNFISSTGFAILASYDQKLVTLLWLTLSTPLLCSS